MEKGEYGVLRVRREDWETLRGASEATGVPVMELVHRAVEWSRAGFEEMAVAVGRAEQIVKECVFRDNGAESEEAR